MPDSQSRGLPNTVIGGDRDIGLTTHVARTFTEASVA